MNEKNDGCESLPAWILGEVRVTLYFALRNGKELHVLTDVIIGIALGTPDLGHAVGAVELRGIAH